MRKNSKLLKNLLTTASALAVVLGSSTSALGVANRTLISDAVGLLNGFDGVAAGQWAATLGHGNAFGVGDTIDVAAHNISTGGVLDIGAINGNGGTLTVGHPTTLGGASVDMDVVINAGQLDAGATNIGAGRYLTIGAGSASVADVGGNVTVNNGGTLTLARDITGDLTTTGNGVVTDVTGTITGNVNHGSTGALNMTGDITGNLHVTAAGAFVGAHTDVTGTVTLDGGAGDVTIHDALSNVIVNSGTLTMNDATGGNVTVNGGTLTLARDITGDLTTTGNGVVTTVTSARDVNHGSTGALNMTGPITGNLHVTAAGVFVGTAATDVTGTVTLDGGAGDVTIHDAGDNVIVNGGALTMNDTIGGLGNSNVTVNGGTLTLARDITGDLTTTGNGVVTTVTSARDVNHGSTGALNMTGPITGNLHVTAAGVFVGTAATDVTGTVTLDGGAGDVTIHDAGHNVIVNGATAHLTMNDMTGGGGSDVLSMGQGTVRAHDLKHTTFTADGGEVNVAGTTTGNIDFVDFNGTYKSDGVITGNVDASTTADRGNLEFTGAISGIVGNIGVTNAIHEVKFNAGGAVSLDGNVKATTFLFDAADTVTTTGTTTGNIDFAAQAGTYEAQGLITGDVTSSGGRAGRLDLITNVGGVTGNITNLTTVNLNAVGNVINLGGNVEASNITFDNGQTGIVTVAGNIEGILSFGNVESYLTIDNSTHVTRLGNMANSMDATLTVPRQAYLLAIGTDGESAAKLAYDNVVAAAVAVNPANKALSQDAINAALNGTTFTATGALVNSDTATLNVDSNFTVTGANAHLIGGSKAINITNQKSLTFHVAHDVDVGANGAITLSGENSKLKFDVDTSGGQKTVAFHRNLVPTGDDKGILQFESTINPNALIVDGDANPRTLGANNGNRLKELIISGSKDIEFSDKIQTYAKKITMTNTGIVTFKNKIDTGVDGSLNVVAAGRMQFGDGGLVASADRQFRVGAVHLHPAAALKIDDKAELIIAAPPRVPLGLGLGLGLDTHKLILGNQVAFDGADSILTIESTDGHETSIDLNEHLDPGAAIGGKGILRLRAFGSDGGVNNSSLTLTTGSVGLKTLGTNPHNLKKLQIVGDKTVTLEHSLDVFTPTIEVANGATFIAKNKTVLNSNITIGIADPSDFGAPAAGAAFMTFDAAAVARSELDTYLAALALAHPLKVLEVAAIANGNIASNAFQEFLFEAAKVPMSVDLLNGKTIETSHANSVFKLSNNGSFASVQFVLKNHLDFGVTPGILELNNFGALNNTVAELVLSSNGGAKTIGTAVNKIPELRITGDRIVRITGAAGDNVDLTNVDLLNLAGGSKLIAETSTIGLTDVVIGEAGGAATFVIDAKNGDFNLLHGKTIAFAHDDSILQLQNTAVGAKTITLKGDLDPGGFSTGVVVLSASGGDNTTSLTIADNGGPHHIGAAPAPGNSIKELRITGDKPIVINAGAQFFADQLNVTGGAIFTTKEVSVAETPIIVVGTPAHAASVIAASAATATISDVTATLKAVKITHANSTIKFETTAAAGGNKRITMQNALGGSINVADPAADNLTDLAGIVELKAIAAGGTLTIAGADATKSLGSAADKRLKSLDIAGNGSVIVNVNTYAKEIRINSTNGDIQFNEIVDSGLLSTLTFGAGSSAASVVKFAENTTIASADFDNKDAKIEIGNNFNGNITAATAGNGTVKFTGASDVRGNISNIKKIDVNTQNVTFTGLTNATEGIAISTGSATFNSAKVTFTGAGSATGNGGSVIFGGHAGNFTLTDGGVLDKADNGGILNLAGNGRVTGTIGATVAVGQINVAGDGSEATFENTVNATKINGGAANQKFIFHRDVTLGKGLGEGLIAHAGSTIDVSTNDLTFKGNFESQNTTIQLGQKTFTYEAGRARLLGAFTVNTEIHNAHADIGNIVVQGAGGNAGTLDLTGVTGVTINVSGGKLDLKDKKYTLVSKDADGIIAPVPAGTVITINDTGFATLSPFWSFDRTTGELISPKNAPAIIVAETARQIDAPVSLDNLNEKGKEDLGKLRNQEEVNEAFISSLAESTSTQAVMEISQGVVENAISSVTSEISSRISSFVSAPTVLFNTPSFTPEVETGPIGGGIGGGTLAPAGVIETGVGVIGTGEVGGGNLGGGTGTGEVGGGNLGGGTGTGEVGGGNLGGGTGTGDAGGGNAGGGTGTGDAGGGNAGSGTGSGTGEGATEQGGTGSGTGGGNKKKAKSTSTSQIGVAAGDGSDGPRHGIWGAPFYGEAQQKVRNKTPGYKAKNGGATVGFDTMVNDNMMLGGALSIINTNIRHRDEKKGDRTKVNSYIWSLYAVHNLVHNFFAQGVLSVSYNEINNKTWKKWQINDPLAPVVPELATSNYSSSSIGGDFTLGKHIPIAQSVVLSPSAGLRYSRYTDAGYTETGPSDQNNTVQKKTFDKLEGIAALRLSSPMSINDVVLIPEVHGMVNYDFTNNKPKIVAKGVDSLSTLPSRASKSPRVSFNAGGGLTFKYKMMEYGATYDGSFSKKYIGHQGSLKIRVNF